MEMIHRIAREAFPTPGERLAVYRTGIGSDVVSKFGDIALERPLDIAPGLGGGF